MDLLTLTYKAKEIVSACETLYGKRWSGIRKAVRDKELKPHHEKNKTKNLLSSAIKLCEEEEDDRVRLILLGSSFGDD